MVRVFFNGPWNLGSIPGQVIPKTKKMILDASLLNTQYFKVRIKGKVEQSRERSSAFPTPWCSSYRKGKLRVTLDCCRQLYFRILFLDLTLTPPISWINFSQFPFLNGHQWETSVKTRAVQRICFSDLFGVLWDFKVKKKSEGKKRNCSRVRVKNALSIAFLWGCQKKRCELPY